MSTIHGNAHRCVCGVVYFDSDGGPCHYKCEDCGRLVRMEDAEDDWGEKCEACHKDSTVTVEED